MAQPPGRIAGKMRWHIYREPPAPNTLMVLGSILEKPEDLESSLNLEHGIKPFPQEQIWNQTEAVRLAVTAELTKESGGRLKAVLPVSPILSAGGGIGATSSDNINSTVEALGIRTRVIKPAAAKAFIDEALLSPHVLEYVKGGFFSRPLYLIIGVATCKKLVLGDKTTREKKASLDGDVSITGSGIDAGAGISSGKKAAAGFELEMESERDFAYRVREFQYSRLRKRIKKTADVTDGAMFSNDDGDEMSSSIDVEVPVFEYFDSDDEDLEDLRH